MNVTPATAGIVTARSFAAKDGSETARLAPTTSLIYHQSLVGGGMDLYLCTPMTPATKNEDREAMDIRAMTNSFHNSLYRLRSSI